MLSNDQIRYAGKAILTYRPLPAPDKFHRSQAKYHRNNVNTVLRFAGVAHPQSTLWVIIVV